MSYFEKLLQSAPYLFGDSTLMVLKVLQHKLNIAVKIQIRFEGKGMLMFEYMRKWILYQSLIKKDNAYSYKRIWFPSCTIKKDRFRNLPT